MARLRLELYGLNLREAADVTDALKSKKIPKSATITNINSSVTSLQGINQPFIKVLTSDVENVYKVVNELLPLNYDIEVTKIEKFVAKKNGKK